VQQPRNHRGLEGFERSVLAEDEDARLMVAAGKGDTRAFATLFDRHQAAVVRFCLRFVGTQARAEELAQDVFIKLYKSAKGYTPTARFKTYLFRIATNAALNAVRRKDVEVMEGDTQTDDGPSALEREASHDTPHAALEGKALEKVVHGAMAAMSERERAAFSLCRFEGLAYKEIAAALDASEAAVKSLIHRATLTMMKHVEAFEGGLSGPERSTA